MTILTGTNVRMALQSIRSTKMRSALTMLGIIIGVLSVITAVSIGEGVRQQVAGGASKGSDTNILTIRPGRLIERADNGAITHIDYLQALNSNPLTDQDSTIVSKLPGVQALAPLSKLSGVPTNYQGETYPESTIIGTTPNMASVLQQKVAYGSFFDGSESQAQIAVVGKLVAEELFKEDVPIGRSLSIRGQTFIVGGVFDEFSANTLITGGDFNKAIFIPLQTAKSLSKDNLYTFQILVEPKAGTDIPALTMLVQKALTDAHGGQEDFSILNPDETVQLANNALSVATSFVAGIAAISLIVGGIGIMNIMFVSVTERTREIGVRKSLGATNSQIYGQFLIEATVISIVGGIIGVILSLIANYLLRVGTNLQPAITLPIILIAVGASTAVGILFGTAPAVKAARKDPIESLRYE